MLNVFYHQHNDTVPAEIRGVNFWRQCIIQGVIVDFIRKFGRTLKYLDMGWTGNESGERFWPALQGTLPFMC